MVDAQYRLVKEHLGVRHLRLVLGNAMGGMQTWIWAQKYPDFMDVAVPGVITDQIASRNWMLRRLIVDSSATTRSVSGNPPKAERVRGCLGVLRHRHCWRRQALYSGLPEKGR